MANKYDAELDLNTDNSLALIARQLRENSEVLEFGPATGRLTRYMRESLHCRVDIVEIDPSGFERSVEYARDGVLGDIETMEWEQAFAGRSYDFVIFADVLEHLRNPGAVLAAVKKYLKKDARILLSVPNVAHNSIIYNLLCNEFQYNSIGLLDDTHIHLFTYHSLQKMIQDCGYCVTKEQATYIKEVPGEFPHSLNTANSLEKYLLEEHPYGYVYQFIFSLSLDQPEEENFEIKKYMKNRYIKIYYKSCDTDYSEQKVLLFPYAEEIDVIKRIELSLGEKPGYLETEQCFQVTLPEDTIESRIDFVDPYQSIVNVRVMDEDARIVSYESNGLLLSDGCFLAKEALQIILEIEKDRLYYVNVKPNDTFLSPEMFEMLEMLMLKNQELMDECYWAKQKNNQLNQKLQEMEVPANAYQAIIHSTSWKMTKGIRVIADFVKRVAQYCKNHILHRCFQMYRIWKIEGVYVLCYKIKNKIQQKSQLASYESWLGIAEADPDKVMELDYHPLVSIVVPVYNVPEMMLVECIESVLNQSYQNFELCMADDASTMPIVKKVLNRYENHEKVKIAYRKKNGHISNCTNTAIGMAEGEFIAFMDCDDILAKNALYEVVYILNQHRELDYIYSDEDKITEDGKHRHTPHFKPDWSPDTFLSLMYTSHLSVYRKSIGDSLGWLRASFEGAQDYDFTLRYTEKTQRIGHIPKILYHWRERKGSTAGNMEAKDYVIHATERAKKEALLRRGYVAFLEWLQDIYQWRVCYETVGNPLVSIIIPSKDNFMVYRRCVDSLKKNTIYHHYEIITVDNGSSDEMKKQYEDYARENNMQYIYQKMDFNFPRMCNAGVQHAKGEYILLLNDDIEILTGKWMSRMLGHAMLPYIGAVGAKLLYPNTSLIQHDGVVAFDSGPSHTLCQYSDEDILYFNRNRIEYNYSAVTAACLMVSRQKYEEVGGLDENFAVAYNDVDFCYKLVEKGYYNVVRNDAVLYHHESLSRGSDVEDPEKFERLNRERGKLNKAHPQFASSDPLYNPNLTMRRGDYSLNMEMIDRGKAYPVTAVPIPHYSENENGKAKIEQILKDGRYIQLSGYYVIQGSKRNNSGTTKIVLVSKDKAYQCPARKEYRTEVNFLTGCEGKNNLSGFHTVIDTAAMEDGVYRLVLRKSGFYTDSGKEVGICNGSKI